MTEIEITGSDEMYYPNPEGLDRLARAILRQTLRDIVGHELSEAQRNKAICFWNNTGREWAREFEELAEYADEQFPTPKGGCCDDDRNGSRRVQPVAAGASEAKEGKTAAKRRRRTRSPIGPVYLGPGQTA